MSENSSKIWIILSKKMTKTREIKIGKTRNLVFISIQPIPDLSCKFDQFWKKNDFAVAKLEKKIWNFFCSNIFEEKKTQKIVIIIFYKKLFFVSLISRQSWDSSFWNKNQQMRTFLN